MAKETEAPIYGTYPDAKMEGADYDVDCARDGDNEAARDGGKKKE